MARTTNEQVEAAVKGAALAWSKLTGDTRPWRIQRGGQGVSWMAFIGDEGTHAPGTSFGHVGRTAGEAWDTLTGLTRAWRDAHNAQQTGKA